MVFCIATFPPSKHLKVFLADYIKKTIEENQKLIETDNNDRIRKDHETILQLAEVCQNQLPKIVLMGQRKQVFHSNYFFFLLIRAAAKYSSVVRRLLFFL